jgi:hypothetical protein
LEAAATVPWSVPKPIEKLAAPNLRRPPPPSTASKLGALGSALGGSLLGGFGKKISGQSDSSSGGSAAPASAVLYETTTQKSGFSAQAISDTAFQVPAGFKQVASPDAAPAT